MPTPGSHDYDVNRTRLHNEYDNRDIELRSAAFNDHTLIPDRYSFEGGNISPPLEWGGIPDGTAELVLLCEDPDAPSGTFTHWVVTNILPSATGVGEGAVPEGGVPGRNGFGTLGWGGPRPPVGDDPHRYFFRLCAADRNLGLGEGAIAEQVHAALEGHTLNARDAGGVVRPLEADSRAYYRVDLVDFRGCDLWARGADFFAGLDAVVRRVDEVPEVDAFFAGDLDVALAVDFVASLLDRAWFRRLS